MSTWSSSDPVVVNPFGNIPYRAAAGFGRSFANPFGQAFGLEGGSRKFKQRLASGLESGAPTAEFIQQAQDFLPTIMPQAQGVGTEIASRAPGLYNQIQSQVDSFLKSLPGFQGMIGEGAGLVREGAGAARGALPAATDLIGRGRTGVDYAGRAVEEAFNPLANSAAYRVASQRALPGITNAAASRGLGGGGAEAAGEQDFLTQLALSMQANEQSNQQAALGGYSNAVNAFSGAFAPTASLSDLLQGGGTRMGIFGEQGARVGQMGIDAAASGQEALDTYAKQLAASYNIPYEAAQNVMKFITAAHNPRLALLQATAPQVAQTSDSKSVL